MSKRVNVVSASKGIAFRTTIARAEECVKLNDGSHFIPKKKLKAFVKEQKKRDEQDRITQERIKRNQKRIDAKKQAYENMQALQTGIIANEIANKH